MTFNEFPDKFPPEDIVVLVRGWGEKKAHYIYAFAAIKRSISGGYRWWDYVEDSELWFAPIAWAELEQPTAKEP